MTDRPVVMLNGEDLRKSALKKAVNYTNAIRTRCHDKEVYTETVNDIVSSFIAYDAVCCFVVSGGNVDSWQGISAELLAEPEQILRALNYLVGLGGDPV